MVKYHNIMVKDHITRKIDILRILLEEEGITIRKLSGILKKDYKNTYYLIKRMRKEGLIELEKKGSAYLIKLKSFYHPLIILAEYKKRESILKNRSIYVIYDRLKRINFPFIMILFGSFVKKKKFPSDIDIIIISEKVRLKELEEICSLMPLNLHITTFTYEEFVSMLKSREFNVINEALKKYIILFGAEDFYRIIENAR